ncbi:similar to Saccharomyces cerevisiae YOR081C TGL5 Bifunctional enzyme with triacylglycerol lipase and lysophosphatidic acid acyltransferase activity [Maudiozyma barnettii]|uniref:Patatin-like phospholipase domain-containing protein n=1 Tax=Maudiozyma barnettii TaxID=61262 RepID=A0A8H2VJ63_9SACH|nr:uncharacterized protein KABA2_09S00616 [Kazachstania barnettii]CAB4256259.1 similar to Saccharomyces cerevisiae YOR081C TGL5 Bifunctional enzyme with triacylglycerol lipase and lysophosphatidic acid acyltransferase activity [Kazachstania barnettii]CAD1784868.1 similar to Saccharomyces cerevisiae YOR081C TGL5 Bifunctional enzyme with triacylglycerol lipase and lysophosphatidic acid acyltransferase activity [Kazachstania barnettii]
MVLQRSSYPVTQYLIERYYEILGVPLPDGPNLELHKNSDELFDIISGNDVSRSTDSAPDITVDNEKSTVDEQQENECMENISLLEKIKGLVNSITSWNFSYEKSIQIGALLKERNNALSFRQWEKIGLKLDSLMMKSSWKFQTESNLYDYKLVTELTEKLVLFRTTEDYENLLYLIRTTWVRNLGETCNLNLYRHSNIGTKKVIETYLHESQLAIDALLNKSDMDPQYMLRILQQTRRNVGRTALVLSGGATFGLFHIGVLSALYEEDLVPRVISGTSAGSIVASIFCVHTRDEIPALLANVLNMQFNIFKDNRDQSNSEDFLIKVDRFFKQGTWFTNRHLVNTMVGFLGDMTFKEAYYRTGRILNITVSSASIFEQPRLLNNLTAPNVLIWSAVCASCAVPGVFPATPLYEKDPKTGQKKEWTGNSSIKFVDGSVENDLPITRLSEMFNIDHIIACQVNFHVFPFLKFSVNCVGGEVQNEMSARFKKHLNNFYDFFTGEIVHYLEIGSELGIARNLLTKLRSVLSQQYSGNVTILPNMNMLFKSKELMNNPSQEFLLYETVNGARATWPKISMIKNNCRQEFALDKAIFFLKEKIIMSTSIKNPLQFSEATIRVSDIPSNKDVVSPSQESKDTHTEHAGSLDDNIAEPEELDSLLIHPNNGNSDRPDTRLRSLSLREPVSLTKRPPILGNRSSSNIRRTSTPGVTYGVIAVPTSARMISPKKSNGATIRRSPSSADRNDKRRKERSSTIITYSTTSSANRY